MAIYFIRHTKVATPKGICYGQSDVPVADSFSEEAEIIKNKIATLSFSFVYSSPLSRCIELATYCGFSNVKIENNLMELNFGDWEMQRWNDIDMRIWKENWVNIPPPNGESFMEMYQRTSHFFKRIGQQEEDILIFTHNGVINCAKAYYENIALENTFNNTTPYGGIYYIKNEK